MKELVPMNDYGIFANAKYEAMVDGQYIAERFIDELNHERKAFSHEDDEKIHQALLSSQNTQIALNLVSEVFAKQSLPWIEHCVRETILRWAMCAKAREKDVHVWFEKQYRSILGEKWFITHRDNDAKNIPDFWLSNGDELVPVECKLLKFDFKALKQLKRYMFAYNCQHGIAVASDLTVDLPENIRFIQFDISDIG